jgi:hypothetical protein
MAAVFVERTEARNTVVLVAERTACIEETEAVVAAVGRIEETDIRGIEGIHVVFQEQERCM